MILFPMTAVHLHSGQTVRHTHNLLYFRPCLIVCVIVDHGFEFFPLLLYTVCDGVKLQLDRVAGLVGGWLCYELDH